jgi:two-component system response regulator HydG
MAQAFAREFSESHEKPINEIDPAIYSVLQAYRWPGNVRELRNCVESMVVIARDKRLTVRDIPANIARESVAFEEEECAPPANLSLAENEKRLIKAALERANGNRRQAADVLDISLRTLYRKLKDYDLA